MDKYLFFNLFVDLNDRFHDEFNNLSLTVCPYTIGLESFSYNNKQLDELISFFSSRNIDFKYCFYNVQIGVRLIFTFNVV